MPAGPLIGILGWFASHLVVWSLLGFLVAGLVVFGVVPMPTRPGAVTTAAAPSTRTPDGPATAAPAADQAFRPPDAAQPPPQRRDAAKGPRLIGGSLPLYTDRPGGGTGAAGPTAPDGFRPSAALPPASPPPTYHDRVQRARRAFWNGEFEAAEAAYMDVIAAFPDDPEAFGELGNLYESMGRQQLARDAFFAAGVRLRNRGDAEKLRQVIDVLAEKGDERSALLGTP